MTDLEPGGPYTPERTAEVAEMMPACARFLNHATLARDTDALEFPADLDRMLAFLATMAQRMPQLMEQSKAWLAAQVESGRTSITYGRYEGRERMAADMVSIHLDEAAGRFADAARALGEAHQITSAISGVDSDNDEER
jgi:hypothetical protein